MPRSEASIHIDRPPEDVWAYVSDVDNLPIWNAAVLSASSDGPLQVGNEVRGQVTFLGKKFDYVNEVVEFEPPKRSAYRSIEAPFPYRGEQTLEPDGDGTKVTSVLESDNIGGFFGKLAEPVVVRMYSRQMRADLENLKEVLEAS